MDAYRSNDQVYVVMNEDEFLELHEELLCCKDNGPYMNILFSKLCGV